MTKVADGVFEVEGIWGGNGFNIAETEDGADAWYPTDHANFSTEGDPAAGDKVKVTFTSEKGNVGSIKVTFLEKGEPAAVIPGGNGTFTVKVTNVVYAEGDVCSIAGNFAEEAWNDSRQMTYDATAGTWSWTGEYPENFEFKVIYNGNWATGGNHKFDGETFYAEFEM